AWSGLLVRPAPTWNAFSARSALLTVSARAESPRHVPEIAVVDDSGSARSTAVWRGTPTIVVLMYSRCLLACPAIAESLRRATLDLKVDSYRVVFFSFDPRDTPADLRAFRETHRLPLA